MRVVRLRGLAPPRHVFNISQLGNALRMRHRAVATTVMALAVASALTSADTANANHLARHWQWGYNFVGADVNRIVNSPWNYWYDQLVEKNSGGTIHHGWDHTDGSGCWDSMFGTTYHFHNIGDLGCGGYVRNFVHYWTGATSYLYVDSFRP